VQDLALGLVESHEVHMDPLLKLLKVPLDFSDFYQIKESRTSAAE